MAQKSMISKNEEFMPKKTAEHYFTALQSDMNGLRDDFDVLRKDVDKLQKSITDIQDQLEHQTNALKSILDIVRTYDIERKEIKSTLWEFDRRFIKLERQLS